MKADPGKDRHLTIYLISKQLKKINREIHSINKNVEEFVELKKPLTIEEFDIECQTMLKNLGYENIK